MSPSPSSPEAPHPRVLVVGTGAVGGYYGAKLQQAGAHVSVVCRSDFDAVTRNGIQINSIDGDFHFTPDAVLPRVADAPSPPDYLLCALKVLPDVDVASVIAPAVGLETAIVLLQNGVEIENPVAAAFPDNQLISALAFICVNRTAPGIIEHLCFGRLALGDFPTGLSPMAQRLAALFESADVVCAATEAVVTARWRKLVWNAPFNPISVLGGGLSTAEMMDRGETERLARAVMEEVAALAMATGHPLEKGIVEKNLEDTRVMKPYRTSMLLDWEAGRPLEVEAILGNAVRAARREGVAIPRIETLYSLLKALNRR